MDRTRGISREGEWYDLCIGGNRVLSDFGLDFGGLYLDLKIED